MLHLPEDLQQTREITAAMAGLLAPLGLTWTQALGLLVVALCTLCVWRRYFSPISDIPGPFAASFTRLWHVRHILKGDQNLELIRLHDKHGAPVILTQ